MARMRQTMMSSLRGLTAAPTMTASQQHAVKKRKIILSSREKISVKLFLSRNEVCYLGIVSLSWTYSDLMDMYHKYLIMLKIIK